MFGISDLGVIMAYLLAFGCLIFALWFGISQWNKEDNENAKKL